MQYVRFVKTLVRFQFGEVVEKVVDALIVRGGQPLESIAAYSKQSLDDTSRSLVVLIQHDIVQTTQEAVDSTKIKRKPKPTDSKDGKDAAATGASAVAVGTGAATAAAAAGGDKKSNADAKAKPSAKAAADDKKSAAADKKSKKKNEKTDSAAAAAPAAAAASKEADSKSDKSVVAGAAADEPTRTIYHVDLEVIRFRARYPEYCIAMRDRFGREGELITDTFCMKGKLTLYQVLESCWNRVNQKQDSAASASGGSGGGSGGGGMEKKWRDNLSEVFRLMVSNGYLKRADTVAAGSNKVLAKKRKAEELVEAHTEKPTKANQAKKKAKLTKTAAEIKNDFNGGAANDELSDPSLYWTFSHDQFLFDAKRDAICDYVTKKFDPTYASIVRAMMRSYPADPNRRPLPLDVKQICDNLEADNNYSGRKLSEDDVTAHLDELRLPHPPIVVQNSDGYLLRPNEVFNELKLKHAISIARDKCGVLGGRIFKLLHVHKRLEEKQIAEFAIAPKKKVREVCYSLLKARFVSLQEIPRGADRNPSRSFFLWGVPTDKVIEMLLDSFLFSWCNVRERYEMEEAIARPVQQRFHLHEQVTAAENERWSQWNKAAERLENAMTRLNRLITLFRDF